MNALPGTLVLILIMTSGMVTARTGHAAIEDCSGATQLEQSFSSGASWTLCASVDDHHALEVISVHYRAPGGILRSVLQQAHIGQILMDYHDESSSRAQIIQDSQTRLVAMTSSNCDGTPILDDGTAARLCSRVQNNRILSKYVQRPGLQSQRWELVSALQREGLVWTISITFTEDGRIIPAVSLSGRAREKLASSALTSNLPASRLFLARATVLATWRLVFNLDNREYDTVQQFDFPLNVALGNRRPMQITDLGNESFATVERDNFRGWRISDPSGTAYYLDPSNSGFNYIGSRYNWARFDVALTRHKPCERYALNNQPGPDSSSADCGTSLDDFVSGESLLGAHPVIWFSQSRTFNPSNEDWPAISNFHQSLTLLPYDWTPASPFEAFD
ncbi:MAG: hypothetical protein AB8B87_21100 [Granulosicoccus sp.]